MTNNQAIQVTHQDNMLAIAGNLNFSTFHEFEKDLNLALSSAIKSAPENSTEAKHIQVDLSGLYVFNSMILSVMLECKRRAADDGKTCHFVHIPAKLAAIISLANLDEIL